MPYRTVNYFKNPLAKAGLKQLLRKAGLKPQQILRTKEEAYKKLVAGRDLSDETLLDLMAAHPELIQRPIVVQGDKAVLARPLDRLSELGIE